MLPSLINRESAYSHEWICNRYVHLLCLGFCVISADWMFWSFWLYPVTQRRGRHSCWEQRLNELVKKLMSLCLLLWNSHFIDHYSVLIATLIFALSQYLLFSFDFSFNCLPIYSREVGRFSNAGFLVFFQQVKIK